MSPLVSGDTPYKVDAQQINKRASLLQKYLCDEQKELQALYALQALMVHMEQPASECPCSSSTCRMPVSHVSGGQKASQRSGPVTKTDAGADS